MKNIKTHLFLVVLFSIAMTISAQTVIPAYDLETKDVNGVNLNVYEDKPFTGFSIQTQKNGKPISWISYKNGLPDGQWQEWYPNGNLRFDSFWKEGKGHGSWKYFHEDGKIRQEEFFDMDAAIGIFKSYWPNGTIQLRSSWLYGKKHGEWTYYDQQGVPIKKENYAENELIFTSNTTE